MNPLGGSVPERYKRLMFPRSTDEPIAVFQRWLKAAKAHKDILEPTAMALATSTPEGVPSVRMVLLKGCDARGFVFYTNFESRKGGELAVNPRGALCFFWPALERQVRVEGSIEKVSEAEADIYFASRGRDSRIGAWASRQSRELKGGTRGLLTAAAKYALRFKGEDVPRPPHWGGFLLRPERIEFWQHGTARLHKRMEFCKSGKGWKTRRLFP